MALGLQTNVQKSSVLPIRCDDQIIATTKELLPCEFAEFPCKYLEVPLSIKKLTNAQIQSLIDKVASMLPGWKAELMNRVGRSVYVQSVMVAKVIYTAINIDLPLWAVKAIEKLMRGFLWRGRKEPKGGHCLLAWAKVAWPKELRGLGIQNIRNLGWALRAIWPWA
jgi:hypothetical protein